MNNNKQLKFLKNQEIDREKWDACVEASPNGLVYALSWYLDIVNPGWDAIIYKDYQMVMPLPVKKKYGITYLIQPYLSKQLGIFSVGSVDDSVSELFFGFILKKYKYINISINRSNRCVNTNFNLISRTNHELDLAPSYKELEKNYSRRTKRNIKKAQNSNIEAIENIDAFEFTNFKEKHSNSRLNDRNKRIIETLVKTSIKNSTGKVIATRGQDGEIDAAAYYLHYKNRIYFSIIASSDYGKECGAMHYLLDLIIHENAGSGKILDFTGSDMKGVAYFNEGFGAIPKKYFYIYSNRIPFARWIMKK